MGKSYKSNNEYSRKYANRRNANKKNKHQAKKNHLNNSNTGDFDKDQSFFANEETD